MSQDEKQQGDQDGVSQSPDPMPSWTSMRMKAKCSELPKPLDSLEPVSAKSTTSRTVPTDHGASTV